MTPEVKLISRGALSGKVEVPPSKSYTHRAVLMAGLSPGQSKVTNPLLSADTFATLRACRAMGAKIHETESGLLVEGTNPKAADNVVDVDNSGTTLRFMTSAFSLAEHGYTVLTGDSSIRRRPMQGLLDALSKLGVKAWSSRGNGSAPVIVSGGGMDGGDLDFVANVSSQFISSILISSPLARGDTALRITRPVSRPYIEATVFLEAQHGITIEREGYSSFRVPGRQEYHPLDFRVPGDFSSAAFVMAAVAIVGGRVEFSGLTTTLPQGDSAILQILTRLGVGVDARPDSIIIESSGGNLSSGAFDLADTPDLLPVVAALALKCDGPAEITGVEHARFKESDRIRVLAEGLSRVGATVEERQDGLKIASPRHLNQAILDPQGDHRMFMAFALLSLMSPEGIAVSGSESLGVSYPSFLGDMERIGAEVAKK